MIEMIDSIIQTGITFHNAETRDVSWNHLIHMPDVVVFQITSSQKTNTSQSMASVLITVVEYMFTRLLRSNMLFLRKTRIYKARKNQTVTPRKCN